MKEYISPSFDQIVVSQSGVVLGKQNLHPVNEAPVGHKAQKVQQAYDPVGHKVQEHEEENQALMLGLLGLFLFGFYLIK